jgi:hypothetical protein
LKIAYKVGLLPAEPVIKTFVGPVGLASVGVIATLDCSVVNICDSTLAASVPEISVEDKLGLSKMFSLVDKSAGSVLVRLDSVELNTDDITDAISDDGAMAELLSTLDPADVILEAILGIAEEDSSELELNVDAPVEDEMKAVLDSTSCSELTILEVGLVGSSDASGEPN